MFGDLDLIIRRYPRDMNTLRVYAIGDVHVGSPEFDEAAIKKKIRIIEDDPAAAVCLCGDLCDYGLRNSKTNVYLATLQPKEQQEYAYHLFEPIADKIAAAVSGNHEQRLVRESGIDPLLTLCCRWGVEEVYRENVAITKYMFGSVDGRDRQNVFVGVTSHGSTRAKHRRYTASFDNVDFGISGHTHAPEYSPRGRIRIDRRSATARHVPYKEIVVDANLKPGGYGMKNEYEVLPPPELQYLELSVEREATVNRKANMVINYHAIQI